MKRWSVVLGLGLLLLSVTAPALGAELRISKQYGVNYLPLIVLEQRKLIEKNAKEAGLGEVSTTWITLAGGAAANDALLSGSVDIIALGVPPLYTAVGQKQGTGQGSGPPVRIPSVPDHQ